MSKELAIKTISNKYSLLTYECEQELIDLVKILRLKKATILVREGMYSDKTYYIIDGCARAYYLKDGKDISDWFTFENQFMAAIIMLLGYAIIAVPTGIVTAEMMKTSTESNTQVCPGCLHDKHDDDAVFCKKCGTRLNP